MLTRRDAFKMGFGAAIYALFGKFLPKTKIHPLALGPRNVILDPLCPPGTIYFLPSKPTLDEANRLAGTIMNIRMDQAGSAMRDMLNEAFLKHEPADS